jgi:WD40 repeat protein
MRPSVTIESNSVENIFLSAVLNYGGEKIIAGGTDKNVTVYQAHSGKALHTFLGHGDKVNSVTWSSSREKCASGS